MIVYQKHEVILWEDEIKEALEDYINKKSDGCQYGIKWFKIDTEVIGKKINIELIKKG